MKIAFSPYHLQPASGNMKMLHREGALLQVRFEDKMIGYADCHPWPELGDHPLNQQLQDLSKGHTSALTAQSLHFARCDAEARAKRISLFDGLTIPDSHVLIADFQTKFIPEQSFKIKIGLGLDKEISFLKSSADQLRIGKNRLRLDFNCRLNREQFHAFVESCSELLDCIEFFEDPFTYHPKQWEDTQKKYNISLACDRESLSALNHPHSCKFLVIKPAIQSIRPFLNAQRSLIITTYLDHPIGQLAAAYTAAKIPQAQIDICGLLSHQVYTTTPFSSRLTQQGSRLIPPKTGSGWGYDDLLEELPWQPLH